VGLNGGGTIGRQVGGVEEDLLGGWSGRVEGECVCVCAHKLGTGKTIKFDREGGLTSCVTRVTLGASRFSQDGICPLVTMKMCLTHGACCSTDRRE